MYFLLSHVVVRKTISAFLVLIENNFISILYYNTCVCVCNGSSIESRQLLLSTEKHNPILKINGDATISQHRDSF